MASTSSTEEWRPIEGFTGYEVSSFGRVRSLPQLVRCRGGMRAIAGQMLKTPIRGAGYQCVCIRKINLLVHRVVAKAFLGSPPFPDAEVNHIDHDRTNPVVTNLEWVTGSENQLHCERHGRRRHASKGKFSGEHPTSLAVIATCMRTGSETRYEAAMDAVRAGFRSDCISRACNGKLGNHAGHYWRFADGQQGRART